MKKKLTAIVPSDKLRDISSDMIPRKENATRFEAKKWNWDSEMQLYEGSNR